MSHSDRSTGNETTIRPYRSADRLAVLELLDQQLDHLIGLDPERRFVRHPGYARKFLRFLQREVRTNHGFLLVGETNGTVVGLASCWVFRVTRLDRAMSHPYRTGLVSELVVLSAHRSRGIGGRLLAEAEIRLRSLGCDTVCLFTFGPNLRARRFYASHGYAEHSVRLGKRIAPAPTRWPRPIFKSASRRRIRAKRSQAAPGSSLPSRRRV